RSLGLVEHDSIVFDERRVQVVNLAKIIAGVVVGLAHQLRFYEVENDLAEVVGTLDTPHAKNGPGHQPELPESKIADALQQFGTLDVMLRADFTFRNLGGFAAQQALRVRESREHELVGFVSVTWVAPNHLGKPGMVHRHVQSAILNST